MYNAYCIHPIYSSNPSRYNNTLLNIMFFNYNVWGIPFQIDFESMTVRSVTSARLLEDREQRQRRLNDEKLKKIESEINGKHYIMYYFVPVN